MRYSGPMDTTNCPEREQTPDEIDEAQRQMRTDILKRGNPLGRQSDPEDSEGDEESCDSSSVSRAEWAKTLDEALRLDGPIVLARAFIPYGARGWDGALKYGQVSAAVLARAYQRDGTESSLILSVRAGSTAWVQRCIKFGANPNWKNHIGQMAAHAIGDDDAWRKIMVSRAGADIGPKDRLYPVHFKRWERFITTAWKLIILPALKRGDPQLDWLNRTAMERIEGIKKRDPRKEAVLDRIVLGSVLVSPNVKTPPTPPRYRRLI